MTMIVTSIWNYSVMHWLSEKNGHWDVWASVNKFNIQNVIPSLVSGNLILVIDSWGKIQAGYFSGNNYNLGHFDECINYRYNIKSDNDEVIEGQYCLVGFSATPNTTRIEDNITDGFDWREM